MNKLEEDIEQKACDWINEHGLIVLKLNVQGWRGWPDRLIIGRNWHKHPHVVFIEFKRTEKDKPRKLQRIIHNQLRGMGFSVYVCSTIEAVKSVIEKEYGSPL